MTDLRHFQETFTHNKLHVAGIDQPSPSIMFCDGFDPLVHTQTWFALPHRPYRSSAHNSIDSRQNPCCRHQFTNVALTWRQFGCVTVYPKHSDDVEYPKVKGSTSIPKTSKLHFEWMTEYACLPVVLKRHYSNPVDVTGYQKVSLGSNTRGMTRSVEGRSDKGTLAIASHTCSTYIINERVKWHFWPITQTHV